MEQQPKEVEKKKNNKLGLIIAFLAILVIIQGVKWYLDHQQKAELKTDLENKNVELEETYNKLESVSNELQLKIEEISKLGGDVEELRLAKEELEAEKDKLQESSDVGWARLYKIRDKVSGYETLLQEKQKEIERLSAINNELLTENTDLKTTQNVLSDSISNLSATKAKLDEKVAIAATLKAENIKISAVNKKGREKEGEFRNRQIENLKVSFNLAENNVAPIEGKDIMLRVIKPSGDVIFDVALGSGTFMKDGREEFFTSQQEILFDNTRQQITFLYNKGSEYETGEHLIELYADADLIGTKTFNVR
ncbi:MAG: chromosome segregation protein SMC [Cyclobacteriaceae bacterium]